MKNLPITHITLYKHGVGFYERRANVQGQQVTLNFREGEMNDILKSLTAIDWGGGQVLGIDYATPRDRDDLLSGCSVRLDDQRSMRDLLISLRGRRVQLRVDQNINVNGTLLGLDEPDKSQPLDTTLVSLLVDKSDIVRSFALSKITSVRIYDDEGIADLRFFLKTNLTQEDYRSVTIRLTSGDHDLSVSYIAPAPTWRVSYRLLVDELTGLAEDEAVSPDLRSKRKALLLGWGIFDNQLEEDLKNISLSLVAGMPISFVYKLYEPFTPERPEVEEEGRVAAGPVEFEEGIAALADYSVGGAAPPQAAPAPKMRAATMAMERAPGRSRGRREDFAKAQQVETTVKDLGELFQYTIDTPVTVGRGHSAMVPILSADLQANKHLIYNGSKMAKHPVATLRMSNSTALTLERGPVTVLDGGLYAGEAMLPFTAAGGEIVVPYAVELGVSIKESSRTMREIYQLKIKDAYLVIEEWDVREMTYRGTNKTANDLDVLVEHPRSSQYKLFESADPAEKTEAMWRFDLHIPARKEEEVVIKQRMLRSRREELRKQDHRTLQLYLKRGLMDQDVYDEISKLLALYDQLDALEKKLKKQEKERERIYKAQKQIQGNMAALTQTGKERTLRSQYVDKLEQTERQLRDLDKRDAQVKKQYEQIAETVNKQLESMG